LPSFTFTADFGAAKSSRPTVTTIKFGDGYEQRTAYGLNSNPRKWNLRFSNRSVSDIDDIEEFLNARGATESFDWTGMRGDESVVVVCREWSRTTDHANSDTLTATFEEVFEPTA